MVSRSLGIDGTRVIGRVFQLNPPEDSGKSVRAQPPWRARGIKHSWDDTDLGATHPTRLDAQKAIETWWEGLSSGPKVPCGVHYKFRPGCVMCEATNVERKLE